MTYTLLSVLCTIHGIMVYSQYNDEITSKWYYCRKHLYNINAKQYSMEKKESMRRVARAYYKTFKQPCILCGSISTEKHHEDYNKPLNVIWLCKECHCDYHNDKLKESYEQLIKNCYRWFYVDKWITYDWYNENKAIFPKSVKLSKCNNCSKSLNNIKNIIGV